MTISNFIFPLGLAPNFLIDGEDYTIPMAIEESSVVAAACKAAKFWRKRGGFKTKIIDFKKNGQVHFIFKGDKKKLNKFFNKIAGLPNVKLVSALKVLPKIFMILPFDFSKIISANQLV